jgi:L-amino acid N-acyltransferase YncA
VDVLVREVRVDDAGAIVGILNPIIEARVYTVLDTPFSVEAEREFIASFPPRGLFRVAEQRQDRRLVGFQSIEPFAACSHGFDHVAVIGTYVDLSCRGKGIGTRLSEVTFEAARRKGYEKILTYVRSDNLSAVAF